VGAIWVDARGFLDFVAEEVAFRSGILLSDHDIRQLLGGTPLAEAGHIVDEPPESMLRVRPEFIDDVVRVLRTAVGNLPDARSGMQVSIELLREIDRSGVNLERLWDAMGPVLEGSSGQLHPSAIDEIVMRSGAPGWAVRDLIAAISAHQERDVNFFSRQALEWDGVSPLENLFKAEAVSRDPEIYLDQKFLDYLAVNGEDLTRVHWRNFERLCAEFFKRRGHVVSLGRGTKDGGIDIRAWSEKEQAGPPLLVIQCKRLSSRQTVEIEWVKAFWTDVEFSRAKSGVIATTSRVSPEGKRIALARGYALSFAENAQVREWARGMWRHSWDARRAVPLLGRYLLPPIRVFRPAAAKPARARGRQPRRRR
jgi:restriction system protein